jgi:N-succinyldiaminopimelate aminotransferase
MELDPAPLAAALRAKRDRLAAGLRAAGFDTLPSAGTYFLNATLGDADATELCQALPHEAGVAAIPLSAFSDGPALSSIVRFAFCKREDVLDEAIERLRKWKGG